MATAASLAGIEAFGLRWRYTITLDLPDIQRPHDECETNTDVILLAHRIAKGLHEDLGKGVQQVRGIGYLKVPATLTEAIDAFRDELELDFILDNPDSLQSHSSGDLAEMAEGLIDELVYRIDGLYDNFDYYRVVVRNRGTES